LYLFKANYIPRPKPASTFFHKEIFQRWVLSMNIAFLTASVLGLYGICGSILLFLNHRKIARIAECKTCTRSIGFSNILVYMHYSRQSGLPLPLYSLIFSCFLTVSGIIGFANYWDAFNTRFFNGILATCGLFIAMYYSCMRSSKLKDTCPLCLSLVCVHAVILLLQTVN
jgi:hypothetical protein